MDVSFGHLAMSILLRLGMRCSCDYIMKKNDDGDFNDDNRMSNDIDDDDGDDNVDENDDNDVDDGDDDYADDFDDGEDYI